MLAKVRAGGMMIRYLDGWAGGMMFQIGGQLLVKIEFNINSLSKWIRSRNETLNSTAQKNDLLLSTNNFTLVSYPKPSLKINL